MSFVLSGTALSQTDPPSDILPSVRVDAPKHVAPIHRQTHHMVSRSIVFHPAPAATSAPSDTPVTIQLAKLASETSSCAGGCQSSFKTADAPWHGCNGSAWPALSSTCRNTGNFKTYNQCKEAGLVMGWRNNDVSWYCSSLALK
jgi:hypothetical protein